jgi:hypothetical protein
MDASGEIETIGQLEIADVLASLEPQEERDTSMSPPPPMTPPSPPAPAFLPLPLDITAPAFHPGIPTVASMTRGSTTRRLRIPSHRTMNAAAGEAKEPDAPTTFEPWADRIQHVPTTGTIRLLQPPPTDASVSIQNLWGRDMTLTEWHRLITAQNTAFEDTVYGPTYREEIRAVFLANQRARALAWWALQRWRVRIWRQRTACNVDLIDLAPIPDADAILLTDTTNRQIYRFHRRDVYRALLSNLCLADEMLPCPRAPTNPYTNQPLTLAQTISICQQLVADYARRGTCPPVLFSAFWAARFNLERFQQENASLLAQHAVTSYFKDLTDDNLHTVFDTLTGLLAEAGLDIPPMAVRRWLRITPQTPLHAEWMTMLRDYTMYMNLHVQIRPSWHTQHYIMADVRRLAQRTPFTAPTSQRMRMLRGGGIPNAVVSAAAGPALTIPSTLMGNPLLGLLGLPIPAPPPVVGLSGENLGTISYEQTLELIQQALFRM